MSAPRISVVVPTYNKARYLELTLASFEFQDLDDFELVVVDDGSSDDTAHVLRQWTSRLPLRALRFPNGGRAVARNRGIAAARGDVVVFCDDDRVVAHGFVAAHAAAHAGSAQPLVGIGWQQALLFELRPGEDVPAQTLARALAWRPQAAAALARGESVQMLDIQDLGRDSRALDELAMADRWFADYILPLVESGNDDISTQRLAWTYGNTGNLSMRRDLLERVGSFDESFRGWGLEDAELHYRMVRAGARTRVLREARNYHLNHPRNDLALRWNWLRNARTFLDKHDSMDIALYIQAELTNMPLPEAERILEEAENAGDSVLLRAYRRLLMNNARELSSYGKMT
jgi:glycosyltransferase involved in cell wall biosynthesis